MGATSRAAAAARLFVEENGDPTNPTILWIHGYCQCRLSWDNQFENEELVSKFHMIRLDLRGHGISDKIADPAAFQDGKILGGQNPSGDQRSTAGWEKFRETFTYHTIW